MDKPQLARLSRWFPFALPLALLAPDFGYVPIYDGRVYSECIIPMAHHFTWSGLICAGHPTYAWVLWLTAFLAMAPTHAVMLTLANLLIFFVGLWAFRGILAALFPEPELEWERTALTALMAIQPVLLGTVIQPSPDLAVACFSLAVVRALLEKRVYHAGAFGLVLVFTKEVGCLFLATTLLVYALVYLTRPAGTLREKLVRVLQLWPATVPLFAFVARVAYLSLFTKGGAFVVPPDNPGGASNIAAEFLSIRLLDGVFRSYSAGILILEFQWLLTLAIAAWIAVALVRWLFAAAPTSGDPERRRSAHFALALFIGFYVCTTRYRTYSLPRYWIADYPVMLLAAYAALRELRLAPRARAACYGLLGLAWLLSARATIDPVSEAVYGTYAFGSHTMLNMDSITSYPYDRFNGGYSRDQIVYNLQFVNLAYLQDQALEVIHQEGVEPVLIDEASQWHLWDTVDQQTWKRTLDPAGGHLREMQVGFLQSHAPPEAYYARYPPFAPVEDPLWANMKYFYEVLEDHHLEHGGYAIDFARLRLQPDRYRAWYRQHPGSLSVPYPKPLCY